MNKAFTINKRFIAGPGRNLVTDNLTGKETRLEARLMQLLCILAQRAGSAISREELITMIWQDYGGGDEGLTQAVSMLRKILLDSDKKLIQTVPKKGYIFNASVMYHVNDIPRHDSKDIPSSLKKRILATVVIILIAGSFVVYLALTPRQKKMTGPPAKVDYPLNIAQEELAEENESNTVITQSPDSVIYKLVIIGDRPPRFYINNKSIPQDKWEPHTGLINSLKRKLEEKKKVIE